MFKPDFSNQTANNRVAQVDDDPVGNFFVFSDCRQITSLEMIKVYCMKEPRGSFFICHKEYGDKQCQKSYKLQSLTQLFES